MIYGAPNRLVLIAVACLAIGAMGALPAHGLPAPEYQVKALFLFNFTSFVDWPAEALRDIDVEADYQGALRAT